MLNKSKQKFMLTGASLCLVTIFACSTTIEKNQVDACSNVAECTKEIEKAKKAREELQGQIKDSKSKSDELTTEVNILLQQVATYRAQIDAATQTIDYLTYQSNELEQSMKNTEVTLKKRLLEMQLSYETNRSLNFIADSSSITEMIERAQAVNDLSNSDRELIQRYDDQNKQVNENKTKMEKTKKELEEYKVAQEKLIQDNSEKIKQYREKQGELEKKDAGVRDEQALSESELQKIKDELNKIPVTPVAPSNNQQPTPSGGQGGAAKPQTPSGGQGGAAKPQTPSGGGQGGGVKPAPTPTNRSLPLAHAVMTSPYAENQFHSTPHNGTDYAPKGDPTLYSMVDGVVVANKFNSARGWLIAIAFNDGRGLKTLLYQHMAGQASIGIGDRVARGQRVGVAGNSGFSFGVHLHVEVGDAGAGGKWIDRGASAAPGLYATERYFGLPYSW